MIKDAHNASAGSLTGVRRLVTRTIEYYYKECVPPQIVKTLSSTTLYFTKKRRMFGPWNTAMVF